MIYELNFLSIQTCLRLVWLRNWVANLLIATYWLRCLTFLPWFNFNLFPNCIYPCYDFEYNFIAWIYTVLYGVTEHIVLTHKYVVIRNDLLVHYSFIYVLKKSLKIIRNLTILHPVKIVAKIILPFDKLMVPNLLCHLKNIDWSDYKACNLWDFNLFFIYLWFHIFHVNGFPTSFWFEF